MANSEINVDYQNPSYLQTKKEPQLYIYIYIYIKHNEMHNSIIPNFMGYKTPLIKGSPSRSILSKELSFPTIEPNNPVIPLTIYSTSAY